MIVSDNDFTTTEARADAIRVVAEMDAEMADYPESFADVPITITEARGEREEDARKWTVRDMLISALRAIDSGETEAEIAFLALGNYNSEGTATRFFAKGDHYEILGVTHRALFMFSRD